MAGYWREHQGSQKIRAENAQERFAFRFSLFWNDNKND